VWHAVGISRSAYNAYVLALIGTRDCSSRGDTAFGTITDHDAYRYSVL